MSTRQEKVERLLKVEISEIIQRDMKDPRLGFVTITDVEVTPDLRYARVFVSVLGSDEDRESSMKALKRGSGFVRSELGRRIRMRATPEVDFRFDDSIQQGARIFEILQQIDKDEPEKE